ncbi:MAG TPA: ABC transporter permease [Chthonomonadaceae bacterium]|nr:ABC transporter permease [Chthonomonadaceae bacterium]
MSVPVQALWGLARGLAAACGLVALLALTFLALGIAPVSGLSALWVGAFGDAQSGHLYPLSETLVKTSPLLLTGLSVVVAWRARLFSIGGEGQLLMGALAATALGISWARLPGLLLTFLMVVAGMAAGAFWGWIAGWLRVRRNVQEVISTIMLNYIALYLLGWMVEGPLQERAHRIAQSDPLPDAALFARLIPAAWSGGIATRLHSGVLLALLAVPVIALFLFNTPTGFALRVVGQNAEAARAARFPVDSLRLRAMAISGALAGLAGVVELLGINRHLVRDFSPGWGYTAIPVALLGGLHPVGTLFSALFFGALTAGSGNLERFSGVSSELIQVLQAVAVLAVVGIRAWQARRAGCEE